MIPESIQNHPSHLCVTVCPKPVVFFLHAHIHKQQQVAMGKATRASVSRKGKSSSAVAEKEPEGFKGWTTVAEFLRKDCKELPGPCHDMSLIHVISSSGLLHGFQAEVNWYTGGNTYVTLPTAVAVAVKKLGVYLAKAKHIRWLDLSEEDQGPQTPSASITHLRWLGTRSQFVKVANERGREFGKKKLGLLMEMLTFNVDSVSAEDESEPQSRASS